MGKHETGRIIRGAAFLALGFASLFTPVGCGNRQPERGPVEQAGHDIDHAARGAAHDVNEAVDEAGEDIDEHTGH